MKKQLSETTRIFQRQSTKSLEGKIEHGRGTGKTSSQSMEQIVKQAGYPDVQSFAEDVIKIGRQLVREYNEELRAWENQTEQKKEHPSEPPKKASVRKNCTAISRKADSSRNGQLRKNLWIENDKKGGNDYEENNF